MTFDADESGFRAPGQYVMIETCGYRKPYQVSDFDSNRFTIVFPADDYGSAELSELNVGDEVVFESGLGHGYSAETIPDEVCIVANGMGIPEMKSVARALLVLGKKCRLVLEYPSKQDIYMLDAFKELVSEIEVVTLDGSNGREGRAVDAVGSDDYVIAGGTLDMLKSLASKVKAGQFSLSSNILAHSNSYDDCYLETTDGIKNCCEDGPVFDKNMIKWETLAV